MIEIDVNLKIEINNHAGVVEQHTGNKVLTGFLNLPGINKLTNKHVDLTVKDKIISSLSETLPKSIQKHLLRMA